MNISPRFPRRVPSFGLRLGLVACVALTWNVQGRGEEKTSLTTLTPEQAFVSFDQLRINKTKQGGDSVEINGSPTKDFLMAHANSRLVYAIPSGAIRFQATGVATKRVRDNSRAWDVNVADRFKVGAR